MSVRVAWIGVGAGLAAAMLLLAAACGGSTKGSGCTGSDCAATGDGSTSDVNKGAGEAGGDAADGNSGNGCPSGRGPAMVRVPAAHGGTYCIDSTEVTQAEYQVFLTSGTIAGQPSYCSWNTTFQPELDDASPPAFDPVNRGNFPTESVDWCDARAFCAWAGKQLCDGSIAGEWVNACTSGGQYAYVYGDAEVAKTCVDHSFWDGPDAAPFPPPIQPVGSLAGCQSPLSSYAGVFDLIDNVAEWVSPCQGVTGDAGPTGGPSSICITLGGSVAYSMACVPTQTDLPEIDIPMNSTFRATGFRCCATP